MSHDTHSKAAALYDEFATHYTIAYGAEQKGVRNARRKAVELRDRAEAIA